MTADTPYILNNNIPLRPAPAVPFLVGWPLLLAGLLGATAGLQRGRPTG